MFNLIKQLDEWKQNENIDLSLAIVNSLYHSICHITNFKINPVSGEFYWSDNGNTPGLFRYDVSNNHATLKLFSADKINTWSKYQTVDKIFRRAATSQRSRPFSETTTFIARRAVRMNRRNILVKPSCSWKTNSTKKHCYGHSRQSCHDKLNQKVFPNSLQTWTYLKPWRKR